jgi:23S rRNA (adenine-N6)-dimethyltransferase
VPGDSAPRRWGWHRLDRRWATRIVAAAAIGPGDLVLDVGAGDGVLCDVLLGVGARVIAFELHPDRVSQLRRRFAGTSTRVVTADVCDLRLPRQPFSVVANPPFAASMAVIRRLVAPGSRLVAADIVVPRHVARRWSEGGVDGAWRWRATFEMTTGCRVPRGAFHPPIERDAVVLRIRRTLPAQDRRTQRPR